MLFNKKISLIIPCKDEQAGLYSLLKKIPDFVDEVIVVDNNSNDNTVKVAQAAGAKAIKEKKEIDGIGYGFAHQKGMKQANGDYIIAMDGDDTYSVKSIKKIIEYMEKNNLDFVSCNRLPLNDPRTITFFRRLGIYILNLWAGLLYGYYFQDILSGMWVMRKETIGCLNVKTGGWDFSPGIKLSALVNKDIQFSEYHIPYYLRVNGRSKLSAVKTGLNHLIYIFKRWLTIDNKLPKIALLPRVSNLTKYLLALFLVKK